MNSKRKQFIAWLLTICMTVTVLGLHGSSLNVSASTDSEGSTESKKITYERVEDISQFRNNGEYKPYTKVDYVFAGWYKSEDESQPLEKDDTTTKLAYAKLVPKEVMNVKAQISATLMDSNTENDESGAIRFVTTVDSDKYQTVGFEFCIDGGTPFEQTVPTAYTRLYTVTDQNGSNTVANEEKPSSVGGDAAQYFVAQGFKNIPQTDYGMSITARTFWVTLDGTKVYGDPVTKTVNQGIFGTTWTDPLKMSCYAEKGADDTYTYTYTALQDQASYLYSKAIVGDVGVAATITALSGQGSPSAGVTVKVGNKSVQFFKQSDNNLFKRISNYEWDSGKEEWGLEEPWYTDGKCQIKAFVKDGLFYFLVNGELKYCMNMVASFEVYDANTPVSIGICGWDAKNGTVSFTNLQYLSGADVASIDASFTSDTRSNKKLQLCGESKIWQVTGTMERTNDAEIGMGFEIRSGEKVLRLVGFKNGILAGNNNGLLNEWNPEKWRTYLLNDRADAFFWQSNTRNSINYKAVIFENVLYVWFDGELCWRVPLTDNELYKFDENSDYELALYIKSDNGGFGQMTNLDTKMGYQVTDQTEFVKDSEGVWRSFTDTMAKFHETLGVENSGRNHTLTEFGKNGMILKDPFTGTYIMSNIQGSCLLYGEKNTGECGLSTDIAWQSNELGWQAGTFINVRIGTEERLFMAWSQPGKVWENGYNNGYNNGLFYLTAPAQWVNKFGTNGDVWSCGGAVYGDGGSSPQIEPYTTEGTSKVVAYVKDDRFHILYNGTELVNRDMTELFPAGSGDYDANTSQVSIGIGGYNCNENAWNRNQATFSNTKFYYDDLSALISE